MGTNFYLREPACSHCGHQEEGLHLGKSSYGWCFSLHVYPEEFIYTWKDVLQHIIEAINDGSSIVDEYGDFVALPDFVQTVTERRSTTRTDWESDWWSKPDGWGYHSEANFHQVNLSKRGPNFLLRHQVDGQHCIGNGEGTYDYIVGEFS
jgi:hypothetical protein